MKKSLCLFLAVLMAASLFGPMLTGCESDQASVRMVENTVPMDDYPPALEGEAEAASEPHTEPVSAPAAAPVTEAPAPVTEAPAPATEEKASAPAQEGGPKAEGPAPADEAAPAPDQEPKATEASVVEEPETTEEPEPAQGPAANAEVPAPEPTAAPTAEPTAVPASEPTAAPTQVPEAGPVEQDGPEADDLGVSPEQTTPTAAPSGEAEATTEPEATPEVVATPDPAATVAPGEVYADANNYENGVWLHVINGGFPKVNYKGVLISEQSSVWVEFENKEQRTLPGEAYTTIAPTRTGGTFEGWYTTSGKEYLASEGDYSYWHSEKPSGQKIDRETGVPEGVQVLYAYFKDSDTKGENERRVEYYYDRNGIDGGMGHYLTSIRSYESSTGGHTLTAGELLIRYLNWGGDGEKSPIKQFSFNGDKEHDKQLLVSYWSEYTFNGYNFKGWASSPADTAPNIWPGDVIKNGASLYAVWEKGDELSQKFDRSDPEGGPVELLQIGGNLDSNKSGSTHASEGASFTLDAFRTPIRAVVKEITWEVSVMAATDTLKDQVAAKSEKLTITYDPSKAVDENGTKKTTDSGIEIIGRGMYLTVKNNDGNEYTVTVHAKVVTEGDVTVDCNADAKVSFYHNWVQQGQPTGTADCEHGVKTNYKCSVANCGEQKTVESGALGHYYDSRVERGNKIIKEPTCTEPGQKTLICLRCNEESDYIYTIPALGHDFKTTTMQYDCKHNEITKACQRENCGVTEVDLVTANNTGIERLHKYTDVTYSVVNCSTSTKKSTCSVCYKIKTETVSANNPTGQHVYGEWVVEKPATGLETGLETRTCTLCKHKESKTIAKLTPGWNTVGDSKVFVANDGNFAAGLTTVSGKKYYFGNNGVMETGWKNISDSAVAGASLFAATGSKRYYFGSDGVMTIGWQTINGKKYYLGTDGVMTTGWQTISGKKYHMNGNGVVGINWQTIDGKKYYMGSDGAMTTGWQTIGGQKYYMGSDGAVQTGWQTIGGKKYHMDGNGVVGINWQTVDGKKYYMGSDGAVRTGVQTIDGKRYYFDGNGCAAAGVAKVSGKIYVFGSNGSQITGKGWQTVNGKKYYLGSDGSCMTGQQTISKKKYYFDGNGVMVTGGVKIGSKVYVFKADGTQQTGKGWKTISGKKYYLNSNGSCKTGWQTISGKKYYFGSDGAMMKGWQTISGKRYYFKSNGQMVKGLQTIGGQKYYFSSKGVMKTNGWQTVSGKKYYFGSDGAAVKGWQTIGGKRYYFKSNGQMATGLQTIGGKKYYFSSKGVLKVNGWQKVSGKKYYFGSDGAALKGWQIIGGKQYYFKSNCQMATGKVKIDGKTYKFGSNGVLKT